MNSSSCDVLILTAGFGHGHITASKAIAQHLRRHKPGISIKMLDFYEFMNPLLYKSIYKGYELLIKTNADVYNFFYDLYNEHDYQELKDFVFANKNAQTKLNNFITLSNPKVAISTFPSCSGYLAMHKKMFNGKYRLVTCITDVTSNKEWLHSGTDLYLVASESVLQQLVLKGVPREHIVVTGIPVRESFLQPPSQDKFSLHPTKRIILFMGGGIGVLPQDKLFYDWLTDVLNVQPIILTGTNEELHEMLTQTLKNKALVLSYTDQIAALMQKADLIVSKAGGITLYESIYSLLPMVIYKPILKQEVDNSQFVLDQGIGLVANDISQLKDHIYYCLSNNSFYSSVKANLLNLKQEINMNKLATIILDIDKNH